MSVAMVVSYALIGLLSTALARRGIGTIMLLGGGMAMSLLTLLLIITRVTDQHFVVERLRGVFELRHAGRIR